MDTRFSKGTFIWWKSLLSDVGPKMITFIEQTVVPAIDSIMIRAFGSNYGYTSKGADIRPLFKEDGDQNILSGFTFKALFTCDMIRDFDGNQEYIDQDEAFFIASLRQIPGIQVDEDSAIMDVKNGQVVFSVKILFGAI